MVDIQISKQQDVSLVEVVGRIDSMTANQLGSTLTDVIDGGNLQIVLDLAQVDFMSSAGLRELVAALKKVKRASGDMRIANPSLRVREVLEMAGLNTIFLIFENQEEAIESF